MNEAIIPALQRPALLYAELVVLSLVANQGESAVKRYAEFFEAKIRNSSDPAWVILG